VIECFVADFHTRIQVSYQLDIRAWFR